MTEERSTTTDAVSQGNADSTVQAERPPSERSFTEEVIEAAQQHGWRPFHLRDRESVHIVRGRGFPDLVMYRRGAENGQIELVAAELKRGRDREPTAEQREWLEALEQHIPAYTWYFEDWDEIESVLRDGPSTENAGGAAASRTKRRRSNSQLPRDFNATICGLAETIEAKEFERGDHAKLRRMNPDDPDTAPFWRLMSRDGMPRSPDVRKWGLIIHGIALVSHGAEKAHNPKIPVGRVLYEGNGKRVPFYSEERLAKLLAARGPTLHRLLARLFRMLGGCAFNWREMAWFILNEGYNEDRADQARVKIARDYYQADNYAQRTQNQQANTQ